MTQLQNSVICDFVYERGPEDLELFIRFKMVETAHTLASMQGQTMTLSLFISHCFDNKELIRLSHIMRYIGDRLMMPH